MGILGAALATDISQAISGVVSFGFLCRKFEVLHMQKGELAFSKRACIRLMGIGVPITRSSRFRMMVFFSASIKFLSLNALMNHSQPPFFAQSSSHGAFRMLFFLNASRM